MSNVRPRRLAAVGALAVAGVLFPTGIAAAAPAHHAANSGPVVTLGSTDLGRILIDGRGRTLYLYTPDRKATSTCYGQCAAFWPPLLTAKKARGAHGVKSSLLGTTKRKDGKLQVTYAGHPLYLFAQDAAPGDVFGQGLQNIWYAVSAVGAKVSTAAPASTIKLAQTGLGSVLVDAAKGMTLYLFNRDTNGTSACYGGCAATWPPLLANGQVRVGPGLQKSLLGTTQRTDGTTQVTYAGHPLYFFSKDTKSGDTAGQAFNNLWWVVSASGTQISS
jgi:predicted lipoprotein with Yx(FWY)xxD motif